MGEIAARGQLGFCFRASAWQHDVFPDTDGIAGKPERLRFRYDKTSGRRNPFGKSLLPIPIEGRGKIQEFTAAQGTQAGVEVIEPAVDQFERNDLPVKPVAERREHTDVRSLSIATEPGIGKTQEVPGPLEETARIQLDDVVPLAAKPVFEVDLLPLPPGIRNTGTRS